MSSINSLENFKRNLVYQAQNLHHTIEYMRKILFKLKNKMESSKLFEPNKVNYNAAEYKPEKFVWGIQ